MLGLWTFLCLVFLLPGGRHKVAMGQAVTEEEEVEGLAAVLRRLAEEEAEGDRVLQVNVVGNSQSNDSEHLAEKVLRELQCDLNDEDSSSCFGTPSSFFASPDSPSLWSSLRSKRMRWDGAVSLFIVPEEDVIGETVRGVMKKMLHRFVTGEGLGIADARRQDLVYRNLFYVFHFLGGIAHFVDTRNMGALERALVESAQVAVTAFDSASNDTLVWWSKSRPDGRNALEVVNARLGSTKEFQKEGSLFPPVDRVYSDMGGRVFQHPVMQKPPWNFVTYDCSKAFVEDNGGRDVTLTEILADKLNFKVVSVDPAEFGIERSRGSRWNDNYTFPHILGMVHRREDPFHFYLGDTTQTYTRNSAVEFSFFVLADSGAFVTQAPERFIPADIMLRSFTSVVWLWIAGTYAVVFAVSLALVGYGRHMFKTYRPPREDMLNLFYKDSFRKCARKVFEGLLRIVLVEDEIFITHHRSPFINPLLVVMMFWMMMFSWVLVPSYQGTLLSFFSSPFTTLPLDSLEELHSAMANLNKSLGVTRGSSSFGVISTGGGIYNQLWGIMQEKGDWAIPSVSQGLHKTLNDPNFAVFAGREKLVYDTTRLGKDSFHINAQVFFSKYKGVVLRNGSPLRGNFDLILERLYDAGIINKITQDEYEGVTRRIGVHGRAFEEERKAQKEEARLESVAKAEASRNKALSLEQMQGSFLFYLFFAALAVASFLCEVFLRKLPKYCLDALLSDTKVDIPRYPRYPLPDLRAWEKGGVDPAKGRQLSKLPVPARGVTGAARGCSYCGGEGGGVVGGGPARLLQVRPMAHKKRGGHGNQSLQFYLQEGGGRRRY